MGIRARKSCFTFGLELPKVRQVMSTDILVVKVNGLRIDNLFELEDDTVVVVDYESEIKNQTRGLYSIISVR